LVLTGSRSRWECKDEKVEEETSSTNATIDPGRKRSARISLTYILRIATLRDLSPNQNDSLTSPLFVDWAITNRCNLHCRHCRGLAPTELASSRAVEVAKEIADLKPGWVIVEGGEPLLRPDLIPILETLREQGLTVYLITNGTLVDDQWGATLAALGIHGMVSIDGADEQTVNEIRPGASLAQLTEASRQLAQFGILDAINMTLCRSNLSQLPAMVEMAHQLGAGSLTVIGFKPSRCAAVSGLTPAELSFAIRTLAQIPWPLPVFVDEPFFWPLVKHWNLPLQRSATSSGIMAGTTTACVLGEYLFIGADGTTTPCTFAPIHVGCAATTGLAELWEKIRTSPFIARLRDPKTRTGPCRECPYLADCKGCRSRTYLLTGDWFGSDPACPLGESMHIHE
jgi:radical SAM protein with 4Fe4S-binding SPASM domain